MISTLIALPYRLARLPLTLVDETLADRLPEDSVPRLTLDRAIGSADKIAGTLLGNREIAERGAERLDRSRTLGRAAKLEKQAEATRQQARETVVAGREEASRKREDAETLVESGLREAEVAEAEGKQQATVRAVKTASEKKAAADQRAANRSASVQQRKQRAESAAQAKKQAAQREARSELDEARESKESAAEKRADAERLEDLTDAKKVERTKK